MSHTIWSHHFRRPYVDFPLFWFKIVNFRRDKQPNDETELGVSTSGEYWFDAAC